MSKQKRKLANRSDRHTVRDALASIASAANDGEDTFAPDRVDRDFRPAKKKQTKI